MLDQILTHLDTDREGALTRLFSLLRIESISTDPAYKAACKSAADWMVDDLNSIGFEASRRDTTGHPMVVAHASGPGPHILFYGHYDVQPVDPLALWNTPPFEPALEETAGGTVIRARGASDDKGQLMTFIEACRAFKAVNGALPCAITILLEGEEESGSPSLIPFLKENAKELRADYALVCDTGMWDAQTPAITTMLRGMVSEDFTVHAANRDLHSGMYGGPAINPNRVVAKILAGLHDDDGRITLPNFYDGVEPVSNAIKAQWESLDFNVEAFLGEVGLSQPAGERGFSALEQIWAQPTCDINGMWGGYTGAGFKTVLPAEASAKVSFRLVGKQDHVKIQASFRKYLEECLPVDCTLSYRAKDGAGATNMPVDAPYFTAARQALSDEWPKEAVFIGCGGSIPIVGHFQAYLGMNSMLIGFGLEDDQIHSPNEKYSLSSFQKGARSWARVLHALAG